MDYIVFDLEFNQPFNFKTGTKTYLNPKCPFEIIQIGAVKLNDRFEIVDSFNGLIRPSIYKRIHPYVEKITGFDMSTFKGAPGFSEVYENFVKFMGDKEETILCTWGIDDIKSLFRNILFYKLDTDAISHKCVNVQAYATTYLNNEPGKSIGLKNAVIQLEIPASTNFHNALNDAEYTAKIFQIVRPENMEHHVFDLSELKKAKAKRRVMKKSKKVEK